MTKPFTRNIRLLVLMLSASATSAFGQNPNYDPGPVWRATYFHLKPGMSDAFWKDFREHGKPVLDEFKKQGFISDYKLFTNLRQMARTIGTLRSASCIRVTPR